MTYFDALSGVEAAVENAEMVQAIQLEEDVL